MYHILGPGSRTYEFYQGNKNNSALAPTSFCNNCTRTNKKGAHGETWINQWKCEGHEDPRAMAQPPIQQPSTAVTANDWFNEWVHTISKTLETCTSWGAKRVQIIGIKGKFENVATLKEWPALLERLQDGCKQGVIKCNYAVLEESRVAFDESKVRKLFDKLERDEFVIVASCPNQHFDMVEELAKSSANNRNVFCSWGRKDDIGALRSESNSR